MTYDNSTNSDYWTFRQTASQIKRISDLFETVFEQQNVGPWKRIRQILATQSVNPIVITQGLNYLNGACGSCSLSAKINVVRDPRMTDLCLAFLIGWYQYEFQPLN